MLKIPTSLTLVPKATRRRIYKEALLYYTQYDFDKPNRQYKESSDNDSPLGLCLLLPCMLWKLNDYMDYAPNGLSWSHNDTPYAFPEINKYLYELNGIIFDDKRKTDVRIKALTEILSNLK